MAQASDGSFPATWTTIGTFPLAGAPAAVFDPVTGQIDFLARGTDGLAYISQETTQNSGVWNDWVLVRNTAGETVSCATDPTVATFSGTNGETWLGVCRNDQTASKVWVPNRSGTAAAAKRSGVAVPAFAVHALPLPPQ